VIGAKDVAKDVSRLGAGALAQREAIVAAAGHPVAAVAAARIDDVGLAVARRRARPATGCPRGSRRARR
jgi:hypothetical protein